MYPIFFFQDKSNEVLEKKKWTLLFSKIIFFVKDSVVQETGIENRKKKIKDLVDVGICVQRWGDLLSGNGFDETLSQYKRIGLFSPRTTEREWYFSVITLPISYYPSYYMAPPYPKKRFFWHPLWNSILDKQLKSGCSVRKKPTTIKRGELTVQLQVLN